MSPVKPGTCMEFCFRRNLCKSLKMSPVQSGTFADMLF
jgi:hypothetical protein